MGLSPAYPQSYEGVGVLIRDTGVWKEILPSPHGEYKKNRIKMYQNDTMNIYK